MLALANQIIGLLSTIAVGIVTALAVQDAVWKRRAIVAIIALGFVQLLFLVMTWEQSNNTAYLALAIMSGWGFLSWLVGTFALQSLAILAVGGALGWLANEVFRKRRTLLGIMVHDKRVWKTDFQIQDLAGPELRRVRDAAVIESNEKHDAWRRAEGKKEEVLASLGPFAAMDDNPKQELALARRKSTETANEYNRAFEKATEADERVLGVIYNKLESGQLIAEGFLPPFNAESEMTSIPAAQWRFLRLEKNMRNATGQGVTYIGVRVTDPKQRRGRS